MPTYVNPSKCDGCGKCVDICPSDIMHLSHSVFNGRKAYNIEPNYCWECYSCVKECPQHAIDMRGYADFNPLNHKLTVLRDKERNVVSWKLKYRDGTKNEFSFAIRTTAWGSISPPQSQKAPTKEQFDSQLLAHEPEYLKSDRGLVTVTKK
ncbi:MAG: adenylyl-sulfate reductase subunit beta [Nitrososphaerota archaeon]|nr:adenylyl-sulfate reductase subunit beta [Nitrososphaerota archaeon]